jgi:hypothetical protein
MFVSYGRAKRTPNCRGVALAQEQLSVPGGQGSRRSTTQVSTCASLKVTATSVTVTWLFAMATGKILTFLINMSRFLARSPSVLTVFVRMPA